MKTLYLLRHAKSSWSDPHLADHDRILNQRGRTAAPLMGRWMVQQRLLPDLVLVSSAVRAQATWNLVRQVWEDALLPIPPATTVAGLYHCDADDFPELLARAAGDAGSLLIIGHNPGFDDWLQHLTGSREHLPTAGLAQIELPVVHWSELTRHTRGQLRGLWRPRDLPETD